jgi:hypothetical protein
MVEWVRVVAGEVDMVGIHMRQATTQCHHSRRLRAQWAHIKRDTNTMTTSDREGIWRMRMGMMMTTTMRMTTMKVEMMVGAEVVKGHRQRVKGGAKMASQRLN